MLPRSLELGDEIVFHIKFKAKCAPRCQKLDEAMIVDQHLECQIGESLLWNAKNGRTVADQCKKRRQGEEERLHTLQWPDKWMLIAKRCLQADTIGELGYIMLK